MDHPPTQATFLLSRLGQGDARASDELLGLLYQELHALARSYMAREREDHTLQPTALVNEAWVRLIGSDQKEWENRGHFFRVAARAMRNVLVDHARAKKSLKRGEGKAHVQLDEVLEHYEERSLDLLALDDALSKLQEMDEQLARIVELRFFAGLTIQETATALEVSTPTIERGWRVARMWLRKEMPGEATDDQA